MCQWLVWCDTAQLDTKNLITITQYHSTYRHAKLCRLISFRLVPIKGTCNSVTELDNPTILCSLLCDGFQLMQQ